jgi:Zn-finger nucleic acid-binding protein
VEIDYCPTCRGVWLDRGELDKIIEKTQSIEYGGSKEKYDDHKGHGHGHGHDHDDHKHSKRKSLLREIFD